MNTSYKQETSISALAAIVDDLAVIKATLSELQAKEKILKGMLEASGHTVIEGSLHRCTVSMCEGRESIDWRAIAAKFNPSRQLITAHTSVGDPYAVIRLSAKKTS